MTTAAPAKISFKQQMLKAREDAIIRAVNLLLAEKGFEAMTVDEVAAQVGIAKASLYKHFPSKEDLGAAAMAHLMTQAQAFLDTLPEDQAPLDKLRATLMGHKGYMDGLMDVSDRLGGWIVAAQAQGLINPKLPAIAVLYTLYARACDPVLEFLKMGELQTDDEIIDLVLSTCFDGLNAR